MPKPYSRHTPEPFAWVWLEISGFLAVCEWMLVCESLGYSDYTQSLLPTLFVCSAGPEFVPTMYLMQVSFPSLCRSAGITD